MSLRPLLLLLLLLACAIGLAAAEPAIRPFKPGVVSYTYREDFAVDVPATLDRIKALGITDIEFSNLFGRTATELRGLLDARGLTCSSFGTSFADLTQKTDVVALQAKTLGATFIRVAYLPGRQPFTLEWAQKTAAEFNAIGKVLREQYQLTFCYHNHGYEFVPHGDGTLFDVLVAATEPENVSYELDILWAFLPGADPAALLRRHGSRIKLMHLKDLKKGVPHELVSKTARDNDVALGDGQIDIPAVLRAAQAAGVAHYYIEDESTSIATQVPASLRYLERLTR